MFGSCGGCGGGGQAADGGPEDAVAPRDGGFQILGAEAFSDPLRSAVRQVERAVDPPVAVVVPKVVERSRVLLAAGDDGGFGYAHGGVVFGCWGDIVSTGKNAPPVPMTSARAVEKSGETFFERVCLVPSHMPDCLPVAPWRLC